MSHPVGLFNRKIIGITVLMTNWKSKIYLTFLLPIFYLITIPVYYYFDDTTCSGFMFCFSYGEIVLMLTSMPGVVLYDRIYGYELWDGGTSEFVLMFFINFLLYLFFSLILSVIWKFLGMRRSNDLSAYKSGDSKENYFDRCKRIWRD